MGILSVGVCEEIQRMTGFFRDARSRVYEVVRRFGSFEAIPKGNPNQYLVPEVKYALNALPRAYFAEHSKKFIDVFNPYDPFFVDQVWNGGKLTATVVLSSASEIEAENSASATVSVRVFVCVCLSAEFPGTTLLPLCLLNTPRLPLFSSSPPPPFRPPLRCRQ